MTLDEKGEIIMKIIKNSADTHIPSTNPQTSARAQRTSNLPPTIVAHIKIKNYWMRRYYRFKDDESKSNFYCLRASLLHEIIEFKSENMIEFLKKTWKKSTKLGAILENNRTYS